jgi:hypothetical protein
VKRDATVVHRTAGDVASLLRANPFTAAPSDAAELVVVFSSVMLDDEEVRNVSPRAWDYSTCMARRTPPLGEETGRALIRIR